jgi:sugar transferase (PEP-CTERM/EpsH1 system associated)
MHTVTSNAAAVSVRAPACAGSIVRRERLRILHVVSCLGMGGTENGVLKIIRGLGDDDFEHRICAVREIDDSFVRRMNFAGEVCSAASSKPGFQFPLFRLISRMKAFRPHVVHARNFGSLEAVAAARLARVPGVVHSEHGYELETLSGLPFRRRILCRTLFPLADAVFTVTADLRNYHSKQSWLAARNFRVIYNGVDTEKFSPRSGAGLRMRKQLGIPEASVVIGSVGRLVPIKDYSTLLDAAEILLRQRRDVHVLLVGDGPERTGLQDRVARSAILTGRVKFAGASDNVPDLLNALDVFVLPSISEGMSNTILEAMASGLAMVVTRAGGNSELVEDGRSGLLFAPRDLQTLAQLLLGLFEDSGKRLSLGAAARARAVEHFGLASMIRQYRDLYLELAAFRGVREGG